MRYSLLIGLMACLAGCAMADYNDRATPTATTPAAMTQQQQAEKARVYREQARQFREMAERRAAEAELLAQDLGPTHEAVRKSRRLALELQAKADEADALAREFRQQVPHNMYQ